MLQAASTTAPARRTTRWRFSTVLPPWRKPARGWLAVGDSSLYVPAARIQSTKRALDGGSDCHHRKDQPGERYPRRRWFSLRWHPSGRGPSVRSPVWVVGELLVTMRDAELVQPPAGTRVASNCARCRCSAIHALASDAVANGPTVVGWYSGLTTSTENSLSTTGMTQ